MRDRSNYTNYREVSNIVEDAEPVADLAAEEREETIIDEILEAEEVESEKTDVIARSKVVNCSSLNIREKPDISANVLTVVMADSEINVVIDDYTSNDFFHVFTSDGYEGYAMKKYIAIEDTFVGVN